MVRLPRKCTIKFINNDPLHAYFIVWMDHDGRAVPRMRLDPGSTLVESTFALHPWRILGIPRGGIPRLARLDTIFYATTPLSPPTPNHPNS